MGVKRQYCGRLGKIENCQVGVFACLGCHERSMLVDFRLFLPEEWARDGQRCDKAKIPEAERHHRTKPELALLMVKAARERGLHYEWVGGDEVYGNNLGLTDALDDMGEVFLMDVARNLKVWDGDPRPVLPKQTVDSGMGRPLTRTRASQPEARYLSVEALAREEFPKHSRLLAIRETTKGILKCPLWAREVWQWEPGRERARRRLLIVRREEDGSHKYSLSNAPAGTSWQRLGYMQAQRFWIERSFQDAKSELGMADYEVRSWRGWHHHMTLVCMAQLFVTRERILCAPEMPLLSARDVVELLTYYLPRRNRSPDEIEQRIRKRHVLRAKAIHLAKNRSSS